MATPESNLTPPLDFDAAIRHFKAANSMASEIHEENEQAAYYQEKVPDPSLQAIILEPLAEEQQVTIEELKSFIDHTLYSQLGRRYLELSARLANPSPEQLEALRVLEEEEQRVEAGAEAALRKAATDTNIPVDRIFIFRDAVKVKLDRIRAEKAKIAAKDDDIREEIAKLETLFGIVSYPWPVPYIKNFSEVNLGDVADRYETDEKEYFEVGTKTEGEDDSWEEPFIKKVDVAIGELDREGLLQEGDVSRSIISSKSQSDIMGTNTALDRLFDSGLISKQKREKLLMGPFEVLCNRMFNANKGSLGKGPRQKRAVEIIHERLEAFFSTQHKTED